MGSAGSVVVLRRLLPFTSGGRDVCIPPRLGSLSNGQAGTTEAWDVQVAYEAVRTGIETPLVTGSDSGPLGRRRPVLGVTFGDKAKRSAWYPLM